MMDRYSYSYGDQQYLPYPHHQVHPHQAPQSQPRKHYPHPPQPAAPPATPIVPTAPNPTSAAPAVPAAPATPPPPVTSAEESPPAAPPQNETSDSPPPPPSSSPPPSKKRRRGITDTERKALRDHFRANFDEKPSQKHLQTWFNTRFDHKVTQSSVSTILSPKYAHLDDQRDLRLPEKMKKRSPDWPHLEEALYDWQTVLSKRDVKVSGEMLREETGRLWKLLPRYKEMGEPKWSNGWLHSFKDRYHITMYKKRMSTKKVMAMEAAKKKSGGV